MISSQELVPTTLESSVIKTALAQPSVLPCGNALDLHCFDLICVRVSSYIVRCVKVSSIVTAHGL
jgi:hypothetical protein